MFFRQILKWLLAAVALWALLIAFCFLYPSRLGYVGLAFLVLWYVYIPILFVVVVAVWPVLHKVAGLLRVPATRLIAHSRHHPKG